MTKPVPISIIRFIRKLEGKVERRDKTIKRIIKIAAKQREEIAGLKEALIKLGRLI